MKKLSLLLFVVLSLPCTSIAKNYDKEYEKLIKKYDISTSAKNADDAEEFWIEVQRMNEPYAIYRKAKDNNTHLAKKVEKDMGQALSLAEGRADSLVYFLSCFDELLGLLREDLGTSNPNIKLHAIDETRDINACTYPDGNIFIEGEMFMHPEEIPYYAILGAVAHECAHYILQHTYTHAYKAKKRKIRNDIINGAVGAVYMAAIMYVGSCGVQTDEMAKNMGALLEGINSDTGLFKFKHSREQEIEADIVAYRFLDFIGVGGDEYLKILRYISKQSSNETSETSDHPSPNYRIGLLQYMKAHPEIERTPPKYILDETGRNVIKTNY